MNHVAANPDITHFISTSADQERQINLAITNAERDRRDVYVVVIDIEAFRSTIVDLSNNANRQHFLTGSHRAMNFARVWSEVLVLDQIPTEAIIETVRYFYVSGEVRFEVTRNPNYTGNNAREPTDEEGNFPENMDHSNYPY
jgi:hypothetical protein